MNGIFIASGPGINRGGIIEDARIIDIAPTILHTLNSPVPMSIDGNVLESIYLNSYLRSHPIRYKDDYPKPSETDPDWKSGEDEKVVERLRGLGYLE